VIINRTGIVGLVIVCGAAGAGGAYVATRGGDPSAVTIAAAPGTSADAVPDFTPVEADTPPSQVPSVDPGVSPRAAKPAVSVRAPERRPRVNPAAVAARSPVVTDSNANVPAQVPSPNTIPSVTATDSAPGRVTETQLVELTVASDTVLGLQLDATISSEEARVEDQVTAVVTREVRVGDRVAIPSGAKAFGEVIAVERGGRLRDRARIEVRFSSLQLADGSRVPVTTDVIVRDGGSASRESAAKIGGGAIGGAIIGGILGGGKGAVLGSTVGAGAGGAAVLAGGRNAAVLAQGTPLTVRLTRPVVITFDR
jgi:hypothetical protein